MTAPDDPALVAMFEEVRLATIVDCQKRLREMGDQLGLAARAMGPLSLIGERMGRNFHDAADALETLKR